MSEDIDIGKISEALNDKLDRDVGNPADFGKERIVGWGMPDYENPTAYRASLSNGDNTITITKPSYLIARTPQTSSTGYIALSIQSGNVISSVDVEGSAQKRLFVNANVDAGTYKINVTGSGGEYSVFPLKGVLNA
jgi:hypothetical protein